MLLDASSSIDDFATMKGFFNLFTSEFQFGVDGAQVGVITIGSVATISVSLGAHMTLASFHEAVSNINFQGGSNNVADAIDLAIQQFLSLGRMSFCLMISQAIHLILY